MQNLFSKRNTNSKNFVWRSIQLGSRQGIMFFILFISAKLLSAEEFGVYNYLIAIAFFFTLLADFGISRAVTKFTAQYNTVDKEKIKYIFFNSALIMIGLVALFVLLILLFANVIIGENYPYIYYLIPVFIFLPLTSLFDGIYSGLLKFKTLSVISLISGLLATLSTYFLVKKLGLVGALLSLDLYYVVSFILFSSTFKLFTFKIEKTIIKDVGRYSLIIGISAVGHFLYAKGITYILGQYNFFTEVGYYEIIDKVFVMSSFPFIIYGQIIAPKITGLISVHKYEEVLLRYKKNLYQTFLLGLLVTLVLWIILPTAVELFLNNYYSRDFIMIFQLLLFHLPLVLVSGLIAQPYIIATGKAKISLLTLPFGIVNVILGILFIGLFGFIGVIYSTLITSITNKLLTFYLISRGLKKQI